MLTTLGTICLAVLAVTYGENTGITKEIAQTCTSCKGEECNCTLGYKLVTVLQCQKVLESSCSESTDCSGVDNAVCTDAECKCDTGYRSHTDGLQCLRVLNSSCTSNDECSDALNMTCTGDDRIKTCQCKSGYIPDTDAISCLQVLGMSCTNSSDCTAVTNAECKDNECTCKSGKKANKDETACGGSTFLPRLYVLILGILVVFAVSDVRI